MLRQNAAGQWFCNLVLKAAGPRVARMIVYEGPDQDGKLNAVFHAKPFEDKKVGAGSVDVTAIGAAADWFRVEIAAQSGRIYR